MSTYNGQKYLQEQIDSILEQEEVMVELFVRDDGSTDHTRSILRKYSEEHNNIHINYGDNIGFRQSFIQELMAHAGFDMYAFSDQDDLWEKEKLHSACKMINEQNSSHKPTVYYSNLLITDERQNIIRKTHLEGRNKSLESVIMRRSIAGCTMVFNSEMWKRISEHAITDSMLRRGHDSFIISLCYAIGGNIICDPNAFIRFRQHQDNTSGSMRGLKERIKKEKNALISKKGQEAEIASAILECWHNEITNESLNTLNLVKNVNKKIYPKICIFFSSKFATGDVRLTILGKIKALTGLI